MRTKFDVSYFHFFFCFFSFLIEGLEIIECLEFLEKLDKIERQAYLFSFPLTNLSHSPRIFTLATFITT